MKAFKKYCLVLVVLLAGTACQKRTYQYIYPTLDDGRYDTEFPYRSCSEQVEEISMSVKKIYALADYVTYHFHAEDKYEWFDLSGLSTDTLLRRSTHITNKFQAHNGTATIIDYTSEKIVLLTCAHIIHFPDTIYTYFDDNRTDTPDYLESISVISKQRFFFTGCEQGKDLEILTLDKETDIALVGKKDPGESDEIVPFRYPLGKSKNLEWGNFVYIMGFPLGYQMITRGIISKPARKNDNYFLIDATFNEGFSGGIILAIRDGVPNFELVGIGRSASLRSENILVPEKKEYEMVYNESIPYEGKMYVKLRKDVNYGVTKAISSYAIKEFYRKNRNVLLTKGYDLDHIFSD